MKTVITLMMSLAMAAVVGCESPRGGGMAGGEGFKIVVPALETKVRQGETKIVTVSLARGDYFKRDVTLDIRATKGISVEPTSALIKGSDKADVTLRITVAKDTLLGNYSVYVNATPTQGEATKTDFTVKVVSP